MDSKIVVGKPELLKQINRNTVIKLIFKHGEISRTEIAKLSKLTLPSVMRIVDGLIEENLVAEVGKGTSTGGRKPNLISMNHRHLYIVGVEIAINVVVVLTDLSGKILDRWEDSQMHYQTPETVLTAIFEQINRMIDANHLNMCQIAGIGIGTPGTNFKYTKRMLHSILKGWEEMDVKGWFESRIACPVFVDNVARTRTLGELWFGIGKEIKDFIYVFIDQGVGCGIVTHGAIQEGYNGVAGEFGHTIIEFEGRECYCGNRGCIEMYVSAGAIISDVNQLSDIQVEQSFSEVAKIENLPQVEQTIKKSAMVLAAGISNLINIINPYAVVIGGIVPTRSKVFTEQIKASVQASVFSKYAMDTKIYLSEIDMTYNGLGSVALVINEIFKSVTVTDQR